MSPFLFSLALLPLAVRAQISLNAVPTSSCAGKPLGTATFSTQLTLATGSQRIPAGDFWNQQGASWKFSTDTEGIIFYALGIPGVGTPSSSTPQQAVDALKIEDSKTTWDLNIPNEELGGTWDIVFQAAPPSATDAQGTDTGNPAATSTAPLQREEAVQPSGATTTSPPAVRRDVDGAPLATTPPDARLRVRHEPFPVHARNFKRQDAGTFTLKIVGTWACLQTPGGTASGTATSTGSPVLASLCNNNEISAGPEAWSTYAVQTYLSSLLDAAAPNPTAPQVFGASIIHDDVNPPGAYCTYTAKCDSISCSNVKDHNSGDVLAIDRYLGYVSVVNLNNYLNAIYTGLLDSGTISSLINAKLVTTFFTNPSPDATWQQIVGIFTPLLGAISAFLGPLSAIGSAAFGVASGVVGAVTAGSIAASIPPVVDKRFDEYADIGQFVGDYLKATVKGIEHAYDSTIGKDSSAVLWGGSDLNPGSGDIASQGGYFGGGAWAKSDYTQGLTDGLLFNFIRILTYKAINFAWKDSGVFIMWTPYGKPLKGADGKMMDGGIDQNYCETQIKVTDDRGTLTVCDASGGMARIINGGNKQDGQSFIKAVPQGWDSGYQILPDEKLNVADAIKGSVASFLEGDFDYDASQPFEKALSSDSGLNSDQLTSISKLEIKASSAGFFNIPVCQVFDLRFNPLVSGSSCSSCGLSTGVKDKGKKFTDNVNDKVKDSLAGPPDCVQAYTSTICSNSCPDDAFYPS